MSDPEDLQGYLASLAYQVMEKLDLLAHLAHQVHQDPLQFMAQVRGCDFAFTVYVSAQACAHSPTHTLPLPTCSSSCPTTLHTYVRLFPSPPALYWLLLEHELELGAQKGQFLCKQFSLPSARGVLLHENSCCGWEEVYVTDRLAKSIKLSS